MRTAETFHLLSDILGEGRIPFMLIGGYVVNLYKVERHTNDIDFLINEDFFKKIEDELKKKGYETYDKKDSFARLRDKKNHLVDVDFVFVDQETFQAIAKEGHEVQIAQRTFLIPSLHHLIALKLHALKNNLAWREMKDFPDIVNLVVRNKIDISTKEFKEICDRHGPEGIYSKIAEKVLGMK